MWSVDAPVGGLFLVLPSSVSHPHILSVSLEFRRNITDKIDEHEQSRRQISIHRESRSPRSPAGPLAAGAAGRVRGRKREREIGRDGGTPGGVQTRDWGGLPHAAALVAVSLSAVLRRLAGEPFCMGATLSIALIWVVGRGQGDKQRDCGSRSCYQVCTCHRRVPLSGRSSRLMYNARVGAWCGVGSGG